MPILQAADALPLVIGTDIGPYQNKEYQNEGYKVIHLDEIHFEPSLGNVWQQMSRGPREYEIKTRENCDKAISINKDKVSVAST